MIDVLMNSLINMGGLDVALENAISMHMSNRQDRARKAAKPRDSADVLSDFIELLLKIATIDALEKFSEDDFGASSEKTMSFIENVLCMVLRFQRLLFARLFKTSPNEQLWPPKGIPLFLYRFAVLSYHGVYHCSLYSCNR